MKVYEFLGGRCSDAKEGKSIVDTEVGDQTWIEGDPEKVWDSTKEAIIKIEKEEQKNQLV